MFHKYRTNMRDYLEKYYRNCKNELKNRPENSYIYILNEEHVAINRYSKGVYKEMVQDIENDLDGHFDMDQADELFQNLQDKLPSVQLSPIEYKPQPQGERLVYRNETAASREQSSITPEQKKKVVQVSQGGAIVGGGAGAVLGLTGPSATVSATLMRTALFGSVGALGGALIAGGLAYMYYQSENHRDTTISEPTVQQPPKEQPASKVDMNQIIDKRHQEVERYLSDYIDRVEKEYNQLLKEAN